MPRLLHLEIGDQLLIFSRGTGKTSTVTVDGFEDGQVRVSVETDPSHNMVKLGLNEQLGDQEHDESEPDVPGPIGSSRVASALQIAAAHEAVDQAEALLDDDVAYIRDDVIFGNTAHPFVDPRPSSQITY